MSNKTEDLIENIRSLLELKKLNSFKLFLKTSTLFSIGYRRGIFLLICFLGFFSILKFIAFPLKPAITILSAMSTDINIIILPVFAVIITGYAIFQALSGGSVIITMMTVKHEAKNSKFEIYNLYFFGLACWYLVLIIVNFVLLIVFKHIPTSWTLTFYSITTNEMISATLISIYLTVVLNFLIEIKSFIYNLFQVFMTSASESTIDHIKKNEEG